jgi:hypothetical protein
MIKINAKLTDDEYRLLKDMLGHMNYDANESKTFASLYGKLIR